MIPFWGKKEDEKQNSATIMISDQKLDQKRTVFPVKLKLQDEFNRDKWPD